MSALGKLILGIFVVVSMYGSFKTIFTESWPIVLGITIFVVGVALIVHLLAWAIRTSLPKNDED
ncbi:MULTISPECIES: hypothetical protein [unclassified Guyparkeria]|uniref:hypothetical protein n=1 Tax=unclassified Guyparkeria TaxID=2626246 RepID=UPI00073375D4|nr:MULTISPECIES: hypothetical protein [unclassified Guyparkeria]KTG15997.1 hypothetical protein AUR63_05985 [Guyparkeria sp. XI15]OAE84752.1 hypothetical protein AWR35_05995 [Guyparkeria sp. WRN-7]